MAIRFRKRVKIAPGIRLNISNGGVSTSIGKPGATVNVGKNGVTGTTGLPGTGLSVQKKLGNGERPSQPDPSHDVSTRGSWLIVIVTVAVLSAVIYALL